jgi:hypothetical protein
MESESETSDDGSKDGSLDKYDHEDLEVAPDDRESEEPVAHCLSGPPKDASPGFSYIAETEPARPVTARPASVDSELNQTEGEASTRLFEGEEMQTEGEALTRVSNPLADPVFFESEPTHTSRRWKCRDMSRLSQCLCGDTVKPNEEGSIQCQKVGCKTVWVSSHFHNWPVLCFDLLANSVHSIISSVFNLGTTIHVHETGSVMLVH